jgi:hypothetical protein
MYVLIFLIFSNALGQQKMVVLGDNIRVYEQIQSDGLKIYCKDANGEAIAKEMALNSSNPTFQIMTYCKDKKNFIAPINSCKILHQAIAELENTSTAFVSTAWKGYHAFINALKKETHLDSVSCTTNNLIENTDTHIDLSALFTTVHLNIARTIVENSANRLEAVKQRKGVDPLKIKVEPPCSQYSKKDSNGIPIDGHPKAYNCNDIPYVEGVLAILQKFTKYCPSLVDMKLKCGIDSTLDSSNLNKPKPAPKADQTNGATKPT